MTKMCYIYIIKYMIYRRNIISLAVEEICKDRTCTLIDEVQKCGVR